ncbi:Ubiquinone biosynthesis protein coq7 [Balamuthia mandrillaris]
MKRALISSVRSTPRACGWSLADGATARLHNTRQCLYGMPAMTSQRRTMFSDEKREIYDRMIRVDQAGEMGAQQIYKGQLAVLKGTAEEPVIAEMARQEEKHLKAFNEMMVKHRVRPSALSPLWEVAGYALGVGTALLGKEAAMACTVAVETVIGHHYNDQLRTLNEKGYEDEEDRKLRKMIKEFRDDELEHLDTGLKHDAEQAPLYKVLTTAIETGSKAAIWVATRL